MVLGNLKRLNIFVGEIMCKFINKSIELVFNNDLIINTELYFTVILELVSIYGIYFAFKQFAFNRSGKYLGYQISDNYINHLFPNSVIEKIWFILFSLYLIMLKPIMSVYCFSDSFVSVLNLCWHALAIILTILFLVSFYRCSKKITIIDNAYLDSKTRERIENLFLKNHNGNNLSNMEILSIVISHYNEEKTAKNSKKVLLKSYFKLMVRLLEDSTKNINADNYNERNVIKVLYIASNEAEREKTFRYILKLRRDLVNTCLNKKDDSICYTLAQNNYEIFNNLQDYKYKKTLIDSVMEDYNDIFISKKKIIMNSVKDIVYSGLVKGIQQEKYADEFVYIFNNCYYKSYDSNMVIKALKDYFIQVYNLNKFMDAIKFEHFSQENRNLRIIVEQLSFQDKAYLFFYFLFYYSGYTFRFPDGTVSLEFLDMLIDKYIIREIDIDEIKDQLFKTNITHRINYKLLDNISKIVSLIQNLQYNKLMDLLIEIYSVKEPKLCFDDHLDSEIILMYIILICVFGDNYNILLKNIDYSIGKQIMDYINKHNEFVDKGSLIQKIINK